MFNFLYFVTGETEATSKKTKKTKESIMSEENVNKNFEESARNIKSSDKAAEVVKEMEKISLGVINVVSSGLPTNQAKYLKRFKANNKFTNMMKREEKAKIAS